MKTAKKDIVVAKEIDEKSQLANSLDEVVHDSTSDWQFLFIVIITIFITLLLLLPKIYIRNSIYYESRAIDRLETQYDALLQEHKLLNRKVEKLKVKNQILDTIF